MQEDALVALGDAQSMAHLVGRATLDIAHGDDRALGRRQPRDGVDGRAQRLVLEHRVLGQTAPVGRIRAPVTGEAVRGATDGFPGHWRAYPADWRRLPEDRLAERETLRAAVDAIAQLPAAQRAVITMRDVQGCPAGEVCDVLGVSEGNQRVLLHRARSRVRAALERHLDG